MHKPMMLPQWPRATWAALLATVVAGGVTCNLISGADSVDFTGESTSSSSSSGSSGSSSSSSGGGPVGDPGTCPGASVTINLGQTLPLINGDTTSATDKFQGANGNYPGCTNCDCMMSNTYTGPDLVYAVTPSAPGMLSATLNMTYSNWHLNVRTKCAGNTPSDEVACVWGSDADASAANPNNLSIPVTQGTTYYVVANSWDGASAGPFTLQLSLQ